MAQHDKSLGATVAGPTGGRPAQRWTPGAHKAVCVGTWQRARLRARDRAGALSTCVASAGRRAAAWNTYIASLIPYPTHIAMPNAATTRCFRAALRAALRLDTPWAPLWALTGLGPMHGISGAPRCPHALARAIRGAGLVAPGYVGASHP